MVARYLIRLDDACSTMDHARWSRLEAVFDEHNIKPLVAVVPDNQDPDLQIDESDATFWDKVRSWEYKGWMIAMHGYQHIFHSIDRKRLIFPYYDKSEFAGLSLMDQSKKIKAAWDIFEKKGIKPTVWIAPAHCFDRITLKALYIETSIRTISDGIALNVYFEDDFIWLPQQLWSLEHRRYGLWTLCLHPNSMSLEDIDELAETLSSAYYRKRIVSLKDVKVERRKKSFLDIFYALIFWNKSRMIKKIIALRDGLMNSNKDDSMKQYE